MTWFVIVGINLAILYFLHNLETVECECVRDWRHNFIKVTAYLAIAATLMMHFKTKIQMPPLIMMFMSLVNVYALFTYIGDLQKTRCNCAQQKQPLLFAFLNVWRFVPVVMLAILAFMFLYVMVIKK